MASDEMALQTRGETTLINFADLASFGIRLTRPAIRVLAKRGKFPKPRRIGEHHIAWVEHEIRDWIANLPAAEDAPLARRKSGKLVKLKPTSVETARAKAKGHKARPRIATTRRGSSASSATSSRGGFATYRLFLHCPARLKRRA